MKLEDTIEILIIVVDKTIIEIIMITIIGMEEMVITIIKVQGLLITRIGIGLMTSITMIILIQIEEAVNPSIIMIIEEETHLIIIITKKMVDMEVLVHIPII